jgi:hypothetical protein
MTNYEKLIDAMTNKMPEETSIQDRHVHYSSTRLAHAKLASYMLNAREGSSVHRTYVLKALEWLVLLKKNNINLHNTIKE